jgi:formimidoylglutamate deiminase
MVNESIPSGRSAMGISQGNHFEIGRPFDAVVYNSQSHLLSETTEKNRLATLVYTSDSSRITGTIVNGKWAIKNQHHSNGRPIKAAFSKAIRELKTR